MILARGSFVENTEQSFRVLNHLHADIDLALKPTTLHFGNELTSASSAFERNLARAKKTWHRKLDRRGTLTSAALHLRFDEIHERVSSGGSR